MNPPALLARFPRAFWWRPEPGDAWPDDWPVVPADAATRFPALAADLRLWTAEIEPDFRRLDHLAQVRQHQFWRQQVWLIIGGLAVTALGAYQTAVGGGYVWVAVAQALASAFLTALTAYAQGRPAQRSYLRARLQAERIKSEFFLFLGRAGDYAQTGRETRFRHQVLAILHAEEAR